MEEIKKWWAWVIYERLETKTFLEIEKESRIDLETENENFRLLGLPFYNKNLKHVFRSGI